MESLLGFSFVQRVTAGRVPFTQMSNLSVSAEEFSLLPFFANARKDVVANDVVRRLNSVANSDLKFDLISYAK